ncbi:RING-H2 finger protein ATL14-like [Corylus avellana]|uniref:RING-H2 finger protein ATL14-like n=1 Tax=Corylus avellana TaxID=13451 RepID=UPI00286C43C2|nr:RING-H2 finger protein ATL14-like [Corylus avellana]
MDPLYIDPNYNEDSLELHVAIGCFIFILLLSYFLDTFVLPILKAFFLPVAGPRVNNHEIDQFMPPVMVQISSSDDHEYGGGRNCVICLEEFKDKEWCRFFPHCNHKFHVPCIDAWLECPNLSCPLCRNSLEDDHAILANVILGMIFFE